MSAKVHPAPLASSSPKAPAAALQTRITADFADLSKEKFTGFEAFVKTSESLTTQLDAFRKFYPNSASIPQLEKALKDSQEHYLIQAFDLFEGQIQEEFDLFQNRLKSGKEFSDKLRSKSREERGSQEKGLSDRFLKDLKFPKEVLALLDDSHKQKLAHFLAQIDKVDQVHKSLQAPAQKARSLFGKAKQFISNDARVQKKIATLSALVQKFKELSETETGFIQALKGKHSHAEAVVAFDTQFATFKQQLGLNGESFKELLGRFKHCHANQENFNLSLTTLMESYSDMRSSLRALEKSVETNPNYQPMQERGERLKPLKELLGKQWSMLQGCLNALGLHANLLRALKDQDLKAFNNEQLQTIVNDFPPEWYPSLRETIREQLNFVEQEPLDTDALGQHAPYIQELKRMVLVAPSLHAGPVFEKAMELVDARSVQETLEAFFRNPNWPERLADLTELFKLHQASDANLISCIERLQAKLKEYVEAHAANYQEKHLEPYLDGLNILLKQSPRLQAHLAGELEYANHYIQLPKLILGYAADQESGLAAYLEKMKGRDDLDIETLKLDAQDVMKHVNKISYYLHDPQFAQANHHIGMDPDAQGFIKVLNDAKELMNHADRPLFKAAMSNYVQQAEVVLAKRQVEIAEAKAREAARQAELAPKSWLQRLRNWFSSLWARLFARAPAQ